MQTPDKSLFIKKSNISKAGKGLFTKIFIPKYMIIAEYKGEHISNEEFKIRTNQNKGNYGLVLNDKIIIDAYIINDNIARYANDANGLQKCTGLKNNSIYIEHDNKMYIMASKNILPKQEIFVSYSPSYWQAFKRNLEYSKLIERINKVTSCQIKQS